MQTTLLVPTDFTKVAHTAIQHAVKLCETMNSKLVIMHIVKDGEGVKKASKKLEEEKEIALSFGNDFELDTIVRVGNIFDDIGQVATEIGASLIIMGTHGASGWQKVTGSYALKVITNSSIPFIVVQKQNMKHSGYDDIVVPLDLHKETKQKLEIVSDMAHYFDSKVHLVTPVETDKFLKNKLNANIAWARKYLASKKVNSSVHIAKKGNNFIKEIISIAAEVDADLITIMNLQKNSLMGMMGRHYEQSILTNELQTPVLCVNPRSTTVSSGTVFTR